MSDIRIRNIDEASLETVIAGDVQFEGVMNLTDPILVKGKISGSIVSGSNLYVGEKAELRTDIEAPVVSIRGAVFGKIHARKRLELFKNGSVHGEIHTPDLIIQSGSRLNGKCAMQKKNETDT
ncbi:MAG: bactofilin family protein [Salinispira sp.]